MKLIDLVFRMNYTLVQGTMDQEISGVVYDSRKAMQDCIFVCMPGAVTDGHKYIPDVIAKGAVAVVVEREVEVPAHVAVIRVDNARLALAELSAAWFGHPAEKLTTIGVTGTKGKTTTTYMIRGIMEKAGLPTGLIGTIEVIIGEEHIHAVNTTPESYLVQEYFARMVDAGIKYVVMEVSSQAMKLDRVSGFTYDYGIFTNLEPDHIGPGEHADMAEYIACKGLLFKRCKVGLANAEADYLEQVMKDHTCTLETYGMGEGADLRATNIQRIHEPGYLGVSYDLTGLENYSVRVDIPGDFTVYNSLAAIALCRHLGVPQASILNALDTIQVKGRLEIYPTPGKYTLMIDYAHNAMSLDALLKNIRAYGPKRIICLFGCGGNRAKSRRYEMGEVSSKLADLTVVTSDNPRFEEPMDIINDILTGVAKADGEYVTIPDRKEAIAYCMSIGEDGDVIILAGKGHEDYQEIKGVKYHMDERDLIDEIIEETRPPKLISGTHHICVKAWNEEKYAELKHFYQDILGLDMVREWAGGCMLWTGNSGLEIFKNGDMEHPTGSINHFALTTDNVQACVDAVRKAGYTITVETGEVTIPTEPAFPLRRAFCVGPVGEEIEFFTEL